MSLETIHCKCGGVYKVKNHLLHTKTPIHKTYIRKKKIESTPCLCGGSYNKYNYKTHIQTTRHKGHQSRIDRYGDKFWLLPQWRDEYPQTN